MLPFDTFIALALFAFVSSITPGPNNLMLLASGVNFGIRRTVPHMLGVALGFMLMIVLIGLGFGQLFALFPWLHTALKLIGALYMLYLAWKLAHAGGIGDAAADAMPMTFLQAAAFQWVNPKAWAMAVTAIAAYTLADNFTASVLMVALVFGIINLPCVSSWTLFGVWLRRFLSNPRTVRIFNLTMAALLVASLWPMAADLF